MKSPDRICGENADANRKITVKWLDDEKEYILIEGTKEDLEFLGNLLISQANFEKDDSFFLSPKGPGNALFTKKSQFGIYILRIDKKEKV
jgi:hypothetical protein